MTTQVYRATAVYGSWYDGEKARGFEGHFIATLSGKVAVNRIKFAKFITPIFQKQILQRYALRVSPGQIRIRFERSEPALASSRDVHADFLEMTYRGKERHARRSTPQLFKLPKRRKRAKKRTRRRGRRVQRRISTRHARRRRTSGRR